MKHMMQIRRSSPVFGSGSIEFLYPANHRVLAYVRQLGKETVLVVNNLSSAAQAVELDLRPYKGNILIEMFGRNIFPRIADLHPHERKRCGRQLKVFPRPEQSDRTDGRQ